MLLISPVDYTPEIEARLNRNAAGGGIIYVVFIMFAACGYVLADVCAGGIVVELAQRKPLAQRGRAQSTVYATRTLAITIGQILMAYCSTTPTYCSVKRLGAPPSLNAPDSVNPTAEGVNLSCSYSLYASFRRHADVRSVVLISATCLEMKYYQTTIYLAGNGN
ncbi:hypothetical protein P3T76_007560 [Phytophthora citrophthora]|uniref:Uncharacterized protein n=1 Tax=Phytophthora citrophthora TaxID=4793 RepID=A0AAD9LN60_9STRA|nr:hypothetical protein P3T76_007560 [Phytophthora citrophthora]